MSIRSSTKRAIAACLGGLLSLLALAALPLRQRLRKPREHVMPGNLKAFVLGSAMVVAVVLVASPATALDRLLGLDDIDIQFATSTCDWVRQQDNVTRLINRDIQILNKQGNVVREYNDRLNAVERARERATTNLNNYRQVLRSPAPVDPKAPPDVQNSQREAIERYQQLKYLSDSSQANLQAAIDHLNDAEAAMVQMDTQVAVARACIAGREAQLNDASSQAAGTPAKGGEEPPPSSQTSSGPETPPTNPPPGLPPSAPVPQPGDGSVDTISPAELPPVTRRAGDSPECQQAQANYEAMREDRARWFAFLYAEYQRVWRLDEIPSDTITHLADQGIRGMKLVDLQKQMTDALLQATALEAPVESLCGFVLKGKWYPPNWKVGMPPSDQPPPIITNGPPLPLPRVPRAPAPPPATPVNAPPPSSAKACTPYACNYMQSTAGGAAQSGVYEMDVCVPASGDWSAATCTIDSTTYAHAVAGQANPDSRTTCGPRPFFGIVKDHASFVQQCKSLNGRVTEPQTATPHADMAQPPSQPDTGIASAPKQQEQPPDTGIASAAEPTHPQQPQGPQAGLPNPSPSPSPGPGPEPGPGPAPGPGSTSNGGGPNINIFNPPPPGQMPGGGHTPNGPPPGGGHPANGSPPAPIPGPPPGRGGVASSGPPPVPSPGPPKQPPGQPGSGGRINGGTCNAEGICVDNAGHPMAPPPNPGDPKPGLGNSPGPATPGTKQKAALPMQPLPPPQPKPLPPSGSSGLTGQPKPSPPLGSSGLTGQPKPLPPSGASGLAGRPPPPPPGSPQQPANAEPPPPPGLPQQVATVAPPPVQPDCQKDHITFYTDQNDKITTKETSVGGGACVHTFVAKGNATLTDASIADPPGNGTLTQLDAFKFKYQPNNGFTGADQYTIEVCGDGPNGPGCAQLTWQTTVE